MTYVVRSMAYTRDQATNNIKGLSFTCCEHLLLVLICDPSERVIRHWCLEVDSYVTNAVRFGTNLKKQKPMNATAITNFLMDATQPSTKSLFMRTLRHWNEEPTAHRRTLEEAYEVLHPTLYKLVDAELKGLMAVGLILDATL